MKTDLGHYQSHSDATFLTQAMEHEVSLLTDTFSCLNMDALIHAVNMLCQAREIYLVGKGLSIPVIELFLARLDFLSIPAKRIPLDNLNLLPNRLVKAGPEDVFVVFSFPNYSPVLGKIAKNVKTVLNSSLICITDKPTAPPACYADALLLCQTSSLVFYNSMTVPISVVTLLTSLMAIKTSGQRACLEEKLKQLENLRRAPSPQNETVSCCLLFFLYHRCLRSSKGNNGQPYCLLENSKWSFTNKSEAKRLWYRIFASMCKRSLSLGQKPFQRRRYFIVEIVHVNCKSNQERNSVPAISKIFEKAASIRPKP